jgi:hypothetical protein
MLTIFFAVVLFLNIFYVLNAEACKDIVACGDATEGNYNLLLKVRDPSRPGLQVLCIIPEGYKYEYHHPWTGKTLEFEVLHKYIGVATKGDTIPNIVKAGMTLTDAGIAFGDADTGSRWKNPTKHAWDDFDWIRYACEIADTEDKATTLLTKDAVDKLHATGVSENLFIVGPKKGVVIEGDAFHYDINEFENGIIAMSNYPKELWRTQRRNTFPISRDFDTIKEKNVRSKGVVRLNSLYGIRVVKIGEDFIKVKPVSFIHAIKSNFLGVTTNINVSERKTVGFLSVELLEINRNKAKIRVTNKYKAWEEKILEYIEPKYGSITINEMINWSRLHTEDLDGLRGMCQDIYEFEAVTIYKIPKENYESLSIGWFSANRPCSSIYVPFHICNTDIYDSFETGEAADLSIRLLSEYGHDYLDTYFSNVEEVFFNEIDIAEKIALQRIDEPEIVSELLTIIDTSIQKQAFITEEIWLEISKIKNEEDKQKLIEIVGNIWDNNYICTLKKMKNSTNDIEKISKTILEKIGEIGLDICKSRIDSISTIGDIFSSANKDYNKASNYFNNAEYEKGFDSLIETVNKYDKQLNGQKIQTLENKDKTENYNLLFYGSILMMIVGILILLTIGLKQKR